MGAVVVVVVAAAAAEAVARTDYAVAVVLAASDIAVPYHYYLNFHYIPLKGLFFLF